ncbi:chemotaxis protein CheA [Oceaniglobus roseus]|uniref:chemotaxis protein CheA n=1 Tax=Oceaniglobus roseus TaxID=1737570 RepID=UPI001FEA1C3C|nr:chemotaxis protein CheA [Kandeliimicrobium roseum]
MRSGKLHLTPEILRVFYRAADRLADLVALGADDEMWDEPALRRQIDEILALSCAAEPAAASPASPDDSGDAAADGDLLAQFTPTALDFSFVPPGQEAAAFRRHRITFAPTAELFANGHEPVHLFRELAALGELNVEAQLDAAAAWDADAPAIVWTLTLDTAQTRTEIQEIFEFAEPFAEIRIEEDGHDPAGTESGTSGSDALAPERAPAPGAMADIASNDPVPIDMQPLSTGPAGPARGTEQVDAPQGAADRAQPDKAVKTGSRATVRVDLELVDALINMVGELVITQSVMNQSIVEAGLASDRRMASTLEEFRTLTRQIQEGVMAIRAQSVKPLFQRMGRIVRETAQIAEKNVRFVTEGEDTEVDRTVIERLVDPLTHILRNAIDHGLEHAERRRAAGKDPTGTVTLSAAHRSGRVVIEVKDDGGGVDRDKVLASAIAKGLVPANANLSPAEIDRLLFTPGFSTASKVTNLSGRGVGMDVVNNEIRSLGGRVAIISEPGQGTTISISLPLTLAVLDGMIVDVGGQTMVVPISAIVETIRPQPSQLHWIGPEARMISVRDLMIPVIDLAAVFDYAGGSGALEREGVLLLVENDRGEQRALAVDRIHDQRQVVIKSLESNYGHVPYVAAATILGDGQIALIVDLDEITQGTPALPTPPQARKSA